MNVGRPSDYNLEVVATICTRLVEGESLRSICRSDEMPGLSTVYRWLLAHEEFREQYARAKDEQADTLADEIIEISDDARNDWMERHGEQDAGWVANGEHIQRSRLRVDARKWIASKLKPKKYGDRQVIEGNPDAPVQIGVTVQFVHPS